MNILFICDEYPPGPHGGIGTAVQLLARELVRQGNRVWVIGLYDYGYGAANEETDEGVRVYRLRKGAERLGISMRYTFYDKAARKILFLTGLLDKEAAQGWQKLLRLIETLHAQAGIDVIEIPDHQHFTRLLKWPVSIAFPALPVVCRLHGGNAYFTVEAGQIPSPVAIATEKALLQQATAISSVSRYTAQKTCALLGLQKEVVVIPNGVEIPPPPVLSAKNPNQVVFTGSLLRKKGVYELMQAWNIVHQTQPEACLTLYGKGDTAALKSLLSPQAQSTVSFKGHQPRAVLKAALQSAAVGVFPSFAETFGLAPIEAMSYGVATIFTRRTSGPEIIDDGLDGLLIDPIDPVAIAEAILKLLQDKAKRERLATRGYEKVAVTYSIERIAEKHIAFYTDIIGQFKKQQRL